MANKKINGITVKIGGDTATLEDALKGVESTSKNLRSELREVNYSLKSNGDSAVLWEQKQELLSKAIEESREKVKILEEAQDQIKEKFLNHEIDDGQYRAFQRELENARYKSKELEDQLEEAGKQAENFGDDIQESGDKAEKSSDGYSVLKGALADLVVDGIKAAADAFKNCTEQAMEFETSIAKVNTIADGSVSIEKMEEDIMNLSNTTGIAAGDISNAVYDAISAGQRTEDAVGFVKNATDLARAGFADTGNSLDLLTTILNAYGLESEKAVEVSDVLIQTQNLGKTTVGELSAAMGKVIPTANSCGVSLEQLAAAYAVMTSNGVATAETTTYINSMLNELSKSGTKSSDILKEKTGKSFQELIAEGKSLSDVLAIISEAAVTPTVDTAALEKAENKVRTSKLNVENAQIKLNTAVEKYGENSAQAATAANDLEKAQIALQTAESDLNGMQEEQNKSFIDMWGSAEAGKAGLILLGDSAADYNSVLDQMKNSSGATETALEKLNTKSHDLEIVQNKLKNTSIKAGKEILASITPLIEKALPKVESTIDIFNKNLPKMIDTGKKLIPVAKGVGAAFAAWKIADKAKPGVKALSELFSSVKSGNSIIEVFNATLKANPIGAVTTAIGAATTAINYFRSKAKREEEDRRESLAALIKDEYKEAAERINDTSDSLKNMKDSFNEQAGNIEAETQRTQDLWKELQTLADESGYVKDADKIRADYILGELNDALDTEYSMTGNQISNYKTMRSEIDKLIEKKKALAYIDAYGTDMTEYGKIRAQSIEELANAQLELNKLENRKEGIGYEAAAITGRNFSFDELVDLYNRKDSEKWVGINAPYLENTQGSDPKLIEDRKKQLLKLAEEAVAYDKNYDLAQKNLETSKANYEEAAEYFKRLEKAEDAVEKGNYDLVGQILFTDQQAIQQIYKDIDKASKEEVQRRKQTWQEYLEARFISLKTALEAEDKETARQQARQIQEALKNGDAAGFSSGTSYKKRFKKIVEEMRLDDIDTSEFAEFGGRSGDDFMSGFVAKMQVLRGLGNAFDIISNGFSNAFSLPMFANGGFLPSGQGIVAEAGPELIEIMNGGAKITPLTGNARNTAVSGADGNRSRVVYINNTINASISGGYDVRRLAEDLAGEQRRVERNMGL